VLVFSISPQLLEPIPRRDSEIGEGLGGVEDRQLAQGDPLAVSVELSARVSARKPSASHFVRKVVGP
jgi:hypothetical protein